MLFKQLIGNVTAIAPLTLNSRKSVEGPLWKWAGDALYIVQSRGDDVTALRVFACMAATCASPSSIAMTPACCTNEVGQRSVY